MHHGTGFRLAERQTNGLDVSQITLKKLRPGVDGQPVSLGEVVEDRDFMAGIKKLFHADTADIPGSPGDKDCAHGRSLNRSGRR